MGQVDSLTKIANLHDFDTTFKEEFAADQTANTILTPSTGKAIHVRGCHVTGNATSGTIRIYFPTSNKSILIAFAGTGGLSYSDEQCIINGQRNEPIKVTSNFGIDKDYFIAIDYKQE